VEREEGKGMGGKEKGKEGEEGRGEWNPLTHVWLREGKKGEKREGEGREGIGKVHPISQTDHHHYQRQLLKLG